MISHGHFDHTASLPQFVRACWATPVYATPMTKLLFGRLLWDKLDLHSDVWRAMREELDSEATLQRVQTVAYGRSVAIGAVRAHFYEAGHIPGAAMIYLESPEGTVLYTGDFKLAPTGITAGACLPASVKPDVLILCGLHARHPNYAPKNKIPALLSKMGDILAQQEAVFLSVSQLTKGIELLRLCRARYPEEQIFLDESIWDMAEHFQSIGLPIMDAKWHHCHAFGFDQAQKCYGL